MASALQVFRNSFKMYTFLYTVYYIARCIKKVVIFIKISKKNEKLLLYLRIFYIFIGFLRDFNKKKVLSEG